MKIFVKITCSNQIKFISRGKPPSHKLIATPVTIQKLTQSNPVYNFHWTYGSYFNHYYCVHDHKAFTRLEQPVEHKIPSLIPKIFKFLSNVKSSRQNVGQNARENKNPFLKSQRKQVHYRNANL